MRFALIAMIALLFAAVPAAASQQGALMMRNWKEADKCAKAAQTAFPDFTAEAIAKREAALKDCLAARNLPPRESLSPGR